MLKGSVKVAYCVARMPTMFGSSLAGLKEPSGGGGEESVGVTSRSKPLAHQLAMRRV